MGLITIVPFKEFGYWWFRHGRMLHGPYQNESMAKNALAKKRKEKKSGKRTFGHSRSPRSLSA